MLPKSVSIFNEHRIEIPMLWYNQWTIPQYTPTPRVQSDIPQDNASPVSSYHILWKTYTNASRKTDILNTEVEWVTSLRILEDPGSNPCRTSEIICQTFHGFPQTCQSCKCSKTNYVTPDSFHSLSCSLMANNPSVRRHIRSIKKTPPLV